ncbi:MAG: hypothetical protein WEA04_03230 [Candidatus Andersenbacteria bacterium]
MNRPLILAAAVFSSIVLLLVVLTWQQNYLLKSNPVSQEAPLAITTAPVLLEKEFVVTSPRPLAECQAERRLCGEDCSADDPLTIDSLCDTECEAEQELCLQEARPAEASLGVNQTL